MTLRVVNPRGTDAAPARYSALIGVKGGAVMNFKRFGGFCAGIALSWACSDDLTTAVTDAGGQGGEGQPCFPNATCDPGLTCASKLCVLLDASSYSAPPN